MLKRDEWAAVPEDDPGAGIGSPDGRAGRARGIRLTGLATFAALVVVLVTPTTARADDGYGAALPGKNAFLRATGGRPDWTKAAETVDMDRSRTEFAALFLGSAEVMMLRTRDATSWVPLPGLDMRIGHFWGRFGMHVHAGGHWSTTSRDDLSALYAAVSTQYMFTNGTAFQPFIGALGALDLWTNAAREASTAPRLCAMAGLHIRLSDRANFPNSGGFMLELSMKAGTAYTSSNLGSDRAVLIPTLGFSYLFAGTEGS